jgi:hypothetical protein
MYQFCLKPSDNDGHFTWGLWDAPRTWLDDTSYSLGETAFHRTLFKKMKWKQSCLCACYEDILGSSGMAPLFLKASSRWRWGAASSPGRFTPGERVVRYPLNKRLGRYQNRSGRFGEGKLSFVPGWSQITILSCLARSVCPVPSTLLRLKWKKLRT